MNTKNHIGADILFVTLFREIKRGTETEKHLFKKIIRPYLERPDILLLLNYVHHKHTTRLQHCLHVSYQCFITCYRSGLDYKSAAIGGLLHDFCPCDKKSDSKKIKDMWCFRHPRIALNNAQQMGETSEIIQDMITTHMFPVAVSFPKYKESYWIIFWDKHCAVRERIFKYKSETDKTPPIHFV